MSVEQRLHDSVWQLVIERARTGSRPGQRGADRARLALAIEGGGMAAAVSGGMCVALEALGLIASFDVIYGSSAGAINACYLAAGQARSRASLYPLAARAGVIDPRQALLGRPVFRLSRLFGELMQMPEHALHERLLAALPSLRVTAARVADKRLDVFGAFGSLDEVHTAVRASCAIPILAGEIVEFRGERYVDGGLVESLPYGVALREGATHVLVLRSRPASFRFADYTAPVRLVIDRVLRDSPDTVAELLYERPGRYNAQAAALNSPETSGLAGRVAQLAPSPTTRTVSQFEARAQRLGEAISLGMATVYHALAPCLALRADGRRAEGSAAPVASAA